MAKLGDQLKWRQIRIFAVSFRCMRFMPSIGGCWTESSKVRAIFSLQILQELNAVWLWQRKHADETHVRLLLSHYTHSKPQVPGAHTSRPTMLLEVRYPNGCGACYLDCCDMTLTSSVRTPPSAGTWSLFLGKNKQQHNLTRRRKPAVAMSKVSKRTEVFHQLLPECAFTQTQSPPAWTAGARSLIRYQW